MDKEIFTILCLKLVFISANAFLGLVEVEIVVSTDNSEQKL